MKINKDVRKEIEKMEKHWITIFTNIYCNDQENYKRLKKEEFEAYKKYKFYCNFLKAIK